jgi:GT2 family glycosyltransferase
MNEILPLGTDRPARDDAMSYADAAPAVAGSGAIALFILGMHRSGTSALAGMLSGLGVTLGERLMPASPANPKGYFEHQDIVAVHDGFLAAIGSSWNSVAPFAAGWDDSPAAQIARRALRHIVARDFAGKPLWALKDPRACRLMPLWRPLHDEFSVEPRFVLMLRHPDEVAASLAARDGIGPARARMLWLRYVLEAEAASRAHPRSILHYHRLMSGDGAWLADAARIADELDLVWPGPPAQAAAAIDELLAPELWHHRTEAESKARLPDWLDMVWSAFAEGDGSRLHAVCDRVGGEVARADDVTGQGVIELERSVATLIMAAVKPQARPVAPVAPPPQAPELTPEPEYAKWLAQQASTAFAQSDWVAEQIERWQAPLRFAMGISLPVGTEARLAPTLRSLQRQFCRDWQLHAVIEGDIPPGFADEPRLIWHRAGGNPIAALNRALCDSDADWVGLIDGGDQLAPEALFAIRIAVEKHPEWSALYSDEDRIDAVGNRANPQFKPDFNLDLVRSMPYTGGLFVTRRGVFTELGGFNSEWDGLEECDLSFRVAERQGGRDLGHIADVLYHRFTQSGRSHRPMVAICGDLPKLVQAHLDRLGVKATAEPGQRPLLCRVRYAHEGAEPLVSIVVPTKNQLPLLKRCVETVLRVTTYENYEIIVIDNGSTSHDALEYLGQIEQKEAEIGSRLRVLRHPGPFNFSAMNNCAVRAARGDYICLLNNDAAPLEGDWLTEMMQHARRPEVGAVGAKLFYPDGHIQHAGVIMGIGWGSPADHPYNGAPRDAIGYWGRLQAQQDFSAVTAACMVTRRSIYEELNGLDENAFAVAYNDVDYCLRVREKGYLVVWTPHARLVHEASASQRSDRVETQTLKEKNARFAREKAAMYARWMPQIAFDPAYNRNLTSTLLGFVTEEEAAPTWNPDFRPRPRVLVHPADREGCGEYRMIAPSRALFRGGVLHTAETMRLMTPPELARMAPASVVFQRQLEPTQIEAIRQTKVHSSAFCVFEIDDLITNLPLKSAYRPAIAADIGQRLKAALALCDRLVVSTEPLAAEYGRLCSDVRVVPNRLEKARWLGLAPGRRDGKPRVGWAGAVGHAGDLSLMAGVVEATARQVDWVFLGMCPDALRPYVKEFHDWVPLESYPKKLASLDLDLAIAPLEFNPFNEAKSNLRLLEYGVLGYPVVCTDITPYQCDLPIVRLKNRHRDWIKTILEMTADRDACRRAGEKLRQAVLAGWMMEDHLSDWCTAWLP